MNWRDTDEGYWIGVVEGMEAAAGIADGWEATYPPDVFPPESTTLDAKAAGHGRHVAKMVAQDIRKAAEDGEIGEHARALAAQRDRLAEALRSAHMSIEAGYHKEALTTIEGALAPETDDGSKP